MKILLSILLLFALLFSACKNEKFTAEQLKSEKEKLKTRIESFLVSYSEKDLNKVLAMLSNSNEFHFSGSDISEINISKSEFQNQLMNDWKLFDSIRLGELSNYSFRISSCGDLAVAVFDTPATVFIKGIQSKFFLRMSLTFINENGLWQISQGLSTMPSVGESSVELTKRMDIK